ncbi:MAG TPA: hydroxyisourate hydrolase, partial [Leclercia adecarboxylata]|nr:hydroxyisourate hydrolase [Leclercia adecarboxylata]
MKKTAPLLLLASMAVAPVAFSAPVGTLSVHMLDQQTGTPPPGVTVTLEKQQQD